MSNEIITDLTDPTAISAVETLYKIMDYPFLLSFIAILPLVIIGAMVYKYEREKDKRRNALSLQGIAKNTENTYWVATGYNKPVNVIYDENI